MTKMSATLASLAFLAVFVGGYLYNRDRKVEARTVAKIESATNNAVQKGKRAAQRSTAPSVRGIRDPSTRDD